MSGIQLRRTQPWLLIERNSKSMTRHQFSSRIWDIMACPFCRQTLQRTLRKVVCPKCCIEYKYTDSGSLDLRLKKPKEYELKIELGTPWSYSTVQVGATLPEDSRPEVDYSDIDVPRHLTKELLSHFPAAKGADSLALDLGCGDAVHRGVCERAGFYYVGLDFSSPSAEVLGDAHSLPFSDNSFEFVLSIAVLEHIQFPLVMAQEAFRVLKPHGKLIGTVAFLEPFHASSFYHHSLLGLLNTLCHAGFRMEHCAPSRSYSVFEAQANMTNPFPKMPRFLSKFLVTLPHVLHDVWWKIGSLVYRDADRGEYICKTTGSFAFVARKPVT